MLVGQLLLFISKLGYMRGCCIIEAGSGPKLGLPRDKDLKLEN